MLADLISYVQERFKPRLIIDLATLTGAIMVALGKEYAGLFANDDKLAARSSGGLCGDGREVVAHAARQGLRQDARLQELPT